jgi:hypothetical protein
MQEATAYAWAAQCLEPLKDAPVHRLQQAADKIAAAMLEAQRDERACAKRWKALAAEHRAHRLHLSALYREIEEALELGEDGVATDAIAALKADLQNETDRRKSVEALIGGYCTCDIEDWTTCKYCRDLTAHRARWPKEG